MNSVSEIQCAVRIDDVWLALGGSVLRGNRGQAFWRGGTHLSVSLDLKRGLWFDHAAGEGGDILALVRIVLGCDFREAVAWLGEFAGVSPSTASRTAVTTDTDWPADLMRATWWSVSAVCLAEASLEAIGPCDPERSDLTQLLARIRLGPASLVHEYRERRRRNPRFTAAMVRAGKLSDARIQRRLARWIVNCCG